MLGLILVLVLLLDLGLAFFRFSVRVRLTVRISVGLRFRLLLGLVLVVDLVLWLWLGLYLELGLILGLDLDLGNASLVGEFPWELLRAEFKFVALPCPCQPKVCGRTVRVGPVSGQGAGFTPHLGGTCQGRPCRTQPRWSLGHSPSRKWRALAF